MAAAHDPDPDNSAEDPASEDTAAEDTAAAHTPAAHSPRFWWIVGIVGCLAMTAIAVWWGLAATVGRVSWQLRSYAVVDSTTVTVTYRIDRPADTAVVCSLKALDSAFGAVGIAEVTIPAGPQRTLTQTSTIRTRALAVTGVVDRCHTA